MISAWITPTQARIDAAQAKFDANFQGSTPSVHAAAEKAFKDNTAAANDIKNRWHVKEVTLMPPYDVSNRGLAWKQISYERSERLGPMLEHWLSHQDVISNNTITVAPPPNSPNGITSVPLLIPVGTGSLTVQGDFRSILAHFLRWNDFNRLVLCDKLQLTGNSPTMTGNYTAVIIEYPQNPTNLGASIPQNGGGAGGGGFTGGGFTGGGGGGFAGAPAGVNFGAGAH